MTLSNYCISNWHGKMIYTVVMKFTFLYFWWHKFNNFDDSTSFAFKPFKLLITACDDGTNGGQSGPQVMPGKIVVPECENHVHDTTLSGHVYHFLNLGGCLCVKPHTFTHYQTFLPTLLEAVVQLHLWAHPKVGKAYKAGLDTAWGCCWLWCLVAKAGNKQTHSVEDSLQLVCLFVPVWGHGCIMKRFWGKMWWLPSTHGYTQGYRAEHLHNTMLLGKVPTNQNVPCDLSGPSNMASVWWCTFSSDEFKPQLQHDTVESIFHRFHWKLYFVFPG